MPRTPEMRVGARPPRTGRIPWLGPGLLIAGAVVLTGAAFDVTRARGAPALIAGLLEVVAGMALLGVGLVLRHHVAQELRNALIANSHRAAAFDHALVGMALVSLDGRLLEVNDAYCTILGRPRAELLELTWRDLTHEDDRDHSRDAADPMRTGEQEGFETEKRYVRGDGTTVWVTLAARLIRDASGAPSTYSAQIVDITARRDAEGRLADSEQRVRTILSSLDEGVCMILGDGSIAEMNDAAASQLGLGAGDVQGRTSADYGVEHLDGDGVPVGADELPTGQTMRTGEAQSGTLIRRRHDDGRISVASVNTRPIVLEGETRPYAVVASFTDVTERLAAEAALAESEERLSLVLRNLPGTLITIYDRDLVITAVEGSYLAETGTDTESVIGRPLEQVIDGAPFARLEGPLRAALTGVSSTVEHTSQADIEMVLEINPYRDRDGAIVGAISIARDVSATVAARRRFTVAFERAPIGMCLVTPSGRIVESNGAFSAMVGLSPEAIRATTYRGFLHPEDVARAESRFAALSAGETQVAVELRGLRPAGGTILLAVEATLVPAADGIGHHILAQVQDITERRRAEDHMRHLADHDPLTGLLNRRGFEAALAAQLGERRRRDAGGVMIMLDLDGFKSVNDTLGHAAGDELLIRCAMAMRLRLRDDDVVARLGGDEFAVLLPAGGPEDAHVVAQALVDAVRTAARAPGSEAESRVTVSAGVALLDDPDLAAHEILVQADRALYRAKDEGGNRFAVHRGGDAAIEPLRERAEI